MKRFLFLTPAFLLSSSLVAAEGARECGNPETAVSILGPAPRLQQVAETVADLEQAVDFYRDSLGLSMLMETNGMAFFDLDGTRLMLGADMTVGRTTHRRHHLLWNRRIPFLRLLAAVTRRRTGCTDRNRHHHGNGQADARTVPRSGRKRARCDG